ncbi:MAG: polyribonucleotide nucleotidyltransferase, partial [Phycisphaerae bacterium]
MTEERKVVKVEKEIAGRTLSLETGRMANQADGAVLVRYGDTVVLATVLTAPSKRDLDFFPLFVEYREMQYAAGKVPGGFFKREGRPSTQEVLTCRMIDRPVRPLFPDGFKHEVQIQCLVLSTDQENAPDILAMIGASAALQLSPAPFQGPIGAARVGYIDGQYAINPLHGEQELSDMDMIVVGHSDGVNMLELGGKEVSEDVVADGVEKGFEAVREVIGLINELAEKVGVPAKDNWEDEAPSEELIQKIYDKIGDRMLEVKQIPGKVERNEKLSELRDELVAEMCPPEQLEPEFAPGDVVTAFYKVEKKVQRKMILDGQRPDSRPYDQVRPLNMEVSVLPRVHGSGLFARGETQTLTSATLGTPRDQQIVDGLQEEYHKSFMLHYNMPPFSVGEIRPIRGPGRREIGHGALAEKSLEGVMPADDEFPYTVRLVSDIMESNGSTSMATVCGGTLALMDAGVPIRAPVAGISIGMVSEGDRCELLTDIIGEEDFHGDMDFKVAGTEKGITGIQLDMKAPCIDQDNVVKALEQARKARLDILEQMKQVLPSPRGELNRYAPRMLTVKIDPEKIGKVIGPGGKTINRIQADTGASIDIEDDGTVYIASVDAEKADAARDAVNALTEEVELGKLYTGKVVSVRDFGAFIEVLPGQDGLCHVSELAEGYVKNVSDVCQVGDEMTVKVINIDDQGRVKVSRKAAILQEEGRTEEAGDDKGG